MNAVQVQRQAPQPKQCTHRGNSHCRGTAQAVTLLGTFCHDAQSFHPPKGTLKFPDSCQDKTGFSREGCHFLQICQVDGILPPCFGQDRRPDHQPVARDGFHANPDAQIHCCNKAGMSVDYTVFTKQHQFSRG